MTSVDQIVTAAADELQEWAGRVIKIIFQSIPMPMVLSLAVWRVYSGPLSGLSCSFRSNRRLLSLWSENLSYVEQLQGSNFAPGDQCWFFAVTSTASALYFLWLCWVVCRCAFVLGQIRHVRGTTKYILPKIGGLIFVASVGLAGATWLMLIVGFEPSRGPAGLSASKVVFFIMPSWYFAAGFAANMLLLQLRYLLYRIREG
jgi:hypothetical protein